MGPVNILKYEFLEYICKQSVVSGGSGGWEKEI